MKPQCKPSEAGMQHPRHAASQKTEARQQDVSVNSEMNKAEMAARLQRGERLEGVWSD